MNDPFDDLDALPARLEDAIEAITGIRPHTEQAIADGMTRDMRIGASTGILIGVLIDAYHATAADTTELRPALDMHHALAVALASQSGDRRTMVAHTLINILVSFLATNGMAEQLGSHALAATDHLEAAYAHIDGRGHSHDEDDDEDGARLNMETTLTAATTESEAVNRLGEAASALGIEPMVFVEHGDDAHAHPIIPVALISGIVTGRATMEMLNMGETVDDHLRGHTSPLWINGFAQGVAFGQTPSDDIIAAAALRLVHIVGAWHDHRPDARFGPAIGALCRAANHAGRAGGLASSGVDVRAEYIANYGTDENDAARKALAAAREAVKALEDAGVTM